MPIRLQDSLTRSLRELKPAQPDGVFRFYNCGPTVYAPAHIGNFRTFIINDVIRRLLELEFGKDKVKHVRNLTDVDDRTIGQADAEQCPLGEITKKWTDIFHSDCKALNCLPPHAEPIATDYIREQVNMIEVLMEKGNAYRAADGSVYFKVSSFTDYGKLSRVKERQLQATDTVADSDHKDSVSDFALWKAWKPNEDRDVRWPGPRGATEGRPGWHIECSAMSKAILGDTIDLHTGGVDLLFPHHENEIAQSQCCNGVKFSNHWYHSEHLLVDGTTMSKSKGNYYVLGDLLAKGYSAMAVRFALLSGHPRKQLNFTLDSLHAAESALRTLASIKIVINDPRNRIAGDLTSHRFDSVFDALREDLNTPGALGALFKIGHQLVSGALGKFTIADAESFEKVLFALGINPPTQEQLTKSAVYDAPLEITALAAKRWAAKRAKDFAGADALRKELAAAGWSMKDGKDGYTLEPLKK